MYEPEELTASKKKELKGKCLVAGCGEPSEKPFDQRYKLCEKHKVVCLPLLPGSTLQLEKYIRLLVIACSQNIILVPERLVLFESITPE